MTQPLMYQQTLPGYPRSSGEQERKHSLPLWPSSFSLCPASQLEFRGTSSTPWKGIADLFSLLGHPYLTKKKIYTFIGQNRDSMSLFSVPLKS